MTSQILRRLLKDATDDEEFDLSKRRLIGSATLID